MEITHEKRSTSDHCRSILLDFYNTVNGNDWKRLNTLKWDVTNEHKNSEFNGIRTNGSEDDVVEMVLINAQIEGTLSKRLGGLYSMRHMSFLNNKLYGQIPNTLCNCIYLERLYLTQNSLSGEIPASFGLLVHLKHLGLSDNHLQGSIPEELGNCTELLDLNLSMNQLSGEIPYTFGKLINLEYLYLFQNVLTGLIPSALGNLVNLKELRLERNQLHGNFPSALMHLNPTIHVKVKADIDHITVPIEIEEDDEQAKAAFLCDNDGFEYDEGLDGEVPWERVGYYYSFIRYFACIKKMMMGHRVKIAPDHNPEYMVSKEKRDKIQAEIDEEERKAEEEDEAMLKELELQADAIITKRHEIRAKARKVKKLEKEGRKHGVLSVSLKDQIAAARNELKMYTQEELDEAFGLDTGRKKKPQPEKKGNWDPTDVPSGVIRTDSGGAILTIVDN
jgi:hypothetical protein